MTCTQCSEPDHLHL